MPKKVKRIGLPNVKHFICRPTRFAS